MATMTRPGRADKTSGGRTGDRTNAGKGGRTQAVKDAAGALDQDVADEVGQEVSGSDRRGDGRSRGAHRGGRGGGVGTPDTMERGGELTEVGDTARTRALADKPAKARRTRDQLAKPKSSRGGKRTSAT